VKRYKMDLFTSGRNGAGIVLPGSGCQIYMKIGQKNKYYADFIPKTINNGQKVKYYVRNEVKIT